jgi:hypothetical protein
MNTHVLKIWPEFYDALESGQKNFELRNDDRGFAVDDVLVLREWDKQTGHYTGRVAYRRVTYILAHHRTAGCAATYGLSPGYVILALAND